MSPPPIQPGPIVLGRKAESGKRPKRKCIRFATTLLKQRDEGEKEFVLHTRISLVAIHLEIALCQIEVLLRNDLVQSELAVGHQLACATVAKDVAFLGNLGRPGDLAAVALTRVLDHVGGL